MVRSARAPSRHHHIRLVNHRYSGNPHAGGGRSRSSEQPITDRGGLSEPGLATDPVLNSQHLKVHT